MLEPLVTVAGDAGDITPTARDLLRTRSLEAGRVVATFRGRGEGRMAYAGPGTAYREGLSFFCLALALVVGVAFLLFVVSLIR